MISDLALAASNRLLYLVNDGVLELTLPWRESVKPRRIQIDTTGSEQKELHAFAS